jgi:type I restriction enzyme R subunit
MAIHNESVFEGELCSALAANGWLHSKNDVGYDRKLALFPHDVFAWLEETQPEELARLVKSSDSAETQQKARQGILERLAKSLDDPLGNAGGTLAVLRHGFKAVPARFDMCQFKPADSLNQATLERYSKNRLRVMQQVHYSLDQELSVDLVFFVNGLPVATVELKTDFTQSVGDAITQYMETRSPKETLFSFGHRALVHFAVSNSEAFMTTKLDGVSTRFLPFNMGDDGRAGNPANPNGSQTAYLWERVWQRDSWLKILGQFMHLLEDEGLDPVTGKKFKRQSFLFPRFHQWEAVNAIVDTSRLEGPGHKYLIQHSAGSGKTSSIAWSAHQLSTLHREDGTKVFDSVIVVTDRTVLDDQLQNAIKQIDAKTGVVAAIDNKQGAKSSQLETALKAGKPIIVVTIQTFPFVFSQVQTQGWAKDKNFAIIADEAHSSQSGETAARLKKILNSAELADLADGGEVDTESVLLAELEARANPKNISFYAFTATPKAKTLELFGRVGTSALPEAFHLYTMQQAIDEGFILDVLQNYTPYKLAFKLSHNGEEYDGTTASKVVDESEAVKSLMTWLRLHPTNIESKVQVIIEHYRANIAKLLDGKAKAMVVTGSRKEAVRYKLAFDKYIANHGYDNVNALVAFSGEVHDPESGPEAFSEVNMNHDLRKRSLPEAFKTDEFQVMLVANKFQTGFDQPLLCAMYVDKKLSGITAVQTLSRLNRMATGKQNTYVVDFVNDPEEILEAFKPYYRDAQLGGVTDPNIVHDIQKKLDHSGVYDQGDVDDVFRVVQESAKGTGNNALDAALYPSQDRFWKRWEQAEATADEAAIDELNDFRKSISAFISAYAFLSQIVDYQDIDLEKHYIYYGFLQRRLRDLTRRTPIPMDDVRLVEYSIREGATTGPDWGGERPQLRPTTGSGTGESRDPNMVLLQEAINKLNEFWSGTESEADRRNFVVHIVDKAVEDSTLSSQALVNTLDQFLNSPDLKRTVIATTIEAEKQKSSMTQSLLNSPEGLDTLTRLIGELIHLRLNAA